MKNNESAKSFTSRRTFISRTLAALATLPVAHAFAESKHGSHHHHHAPNRHSDLVNAALHCVKTAQYCRDHCIELIKAGDTSMSDCLEAVTDTVSMCETLVHLAVADNRHLKDFARVCIKVCKDCEQECEPHKEKHKECKDCMESCIACIEQLEIIVA